MVKQFINSLTGEFVEAKQVQVVTLAEPEYKFQTRYNYKPQGGSEENSGEYVVDDSQYIDFKKLLQRSAQCSKEATSFLASIPVVDNVGGIDEADLQNVIDNNETQVSVDNSSELSTGTTESPQEASEVVNPVENLPDVEAKAETNGN